MKRLLQFFASYKLFSVALLADVAALILQLSGQHTAANILLASVAIIEVLPLLWEMWQDLRMGKYGIDILAATAIVVSVLLGQYWAGLVVVLMLTGGKSLEDFAEHRAKSELDALLQKAPNIAHVIRKGRTIEVDVSDIHVGEKLLIKAGELVPVDATVIDGMADFNEASLTGESLPQSKAVGDQLLSGSINLDGPVTAKATATAENSQYQQIIKLVRGASASQAPFVRLADRYSLPFTLMAFAVGGAVWVISGEAVRFLEVIIVATPCPLLLAAPIALISGMARSSRYGVIVKNGAALERLAEARSIAFDKTGTLTSGELTVHGVKVFNKYQPEEVLALAASLEQNSSHIVAHAIINEAKTNRVKPAKSKQIQEIAGLGMTAQYKGKTLVIGRLKLLEEHGIQLPPKSKQSEISKTAVYVGVDGLLAGVITLSDDLRPEATATLDHLKSLGMREIIMVTGDNQTTAKLIAKQVGISHVHAEALPADKLHIQAEAKYRPMVFVGDGVNDAPILTAADVGIALGAGGSTAASESADMVIIPDDLSRVATAFEIAKKTFTIAKQSILVGIGLSLLLMAVFATGKFPPLAGAIAQEVVDVVVIFNALRAHVISVTELR